MKKSFLRAKKKKVVMTFLVGLAAGLRWSNFKERFEKLGKTGATENPCESCEQHAKI